MNRAEFDAGIARLVGVYGKGITEGLIAELHRRYWPIPEMDWNPLVRRGIETCKNSPRGAHFKELEERSVERAVKATAEFCGECFSGWVTMWMIVGGQPYEAVAPCECAPQLAKGLAKDLRTDADWISKEEYEFALREIRERKPPPPEEEEAKPVEPKKRPPITTIAGLMSLDREIEQEEDLLKEEERAWDRAVELGFVSNDAGVPEEVDDERTAIQGYEGFEEDAEGMPEGF